MTYAQFLFLFVALPGRVVFLYLSVMKRGTVVRLGWAALTLHVGAALAYTMPWDNCPVCSGVWWYERARIWGITLGWVPLEEYLFFAFQTLLTGVLALAVLSRPFPQREAHDTRLGLRLAPAAAAAVGTLVSAAALVLGIEPARYVSLILVWALPPIAIQCLFGADILVRLRSSVVPLILLPTFYLSLANALAIRAGIWTISPRFSLGLLLGGLPVEEGVFFLVTNSLIVFGMTLLLTAAGQERGRTLLRHLQPRRRGPLANSAPLRKETSP